MNEIFKQLEEKIDKTIEKKVKEIELKLKKETSSKILLIKNDIFVSYTVFIMDYIKSYFSKIYGTDNYNENSLSNSISFLRGGFLPDFSYDTNLFFWNSDINADTNKFNENSIYDFTYVGRTGDIDNLETLDNLENDKDMGEYEDYSTQNNTKSNFSFYNKINRQGAFANLQDTYKNAHIEANKAFNQRLQTMIIPNLYKKYGIKIG